MIRIKSQRERSQHLSSVSPTSEGSRQPTLQLQEPEYQYDIEVARAENGYQSDTALNGYTKSDDNTFDGSNTSHVIQNPSTDNLHQGAAENLYQHFPPQSETYDEFQPPNIYMNNSSGQHNL